MTVQVMPDMWTPVPMPAQVSAKEGMAKLSGGGSLWYWDTGGEGPAIVLLHAGTGSGAFWGYQQPVLAKAGYRVIGYSRRGHFRSEGDAGNPGVASADLNELVDFLGIGKFHVLGLAAGGIVATDYALSYPERLLSLTLASTIMGVTDKSYADLSNLIRPSFFASLPKDFQELGPSYRAGNPAGAAEWLRLEEEAISGKRLIQKNANEITWAAVETIRTPTLLLTGGADLYTPPSMLRLQASHLRHAEVHIIEEAGHAPNWEQPETFNAVLLDFLKRH